MTAKKDAKTLVIVESPAKASTIEGYLGDGYKVVSSFGHIRDLPKSKIGIDTENNYEPKYITSKDKQKVATQLKKQAKQAKEVVLATDEDREGEAIAWHVSELLNLDADKTKRIVFHEITKPAIKQAMLNPRMIDSKLVDAQQARRILDRLVGYKLSPLLWKKVQRGLSAGRVQSVAVRLIAEREAKIKDFADDRYFQVSATLEREGQQFEAKTKLDEADISRDLLQSLSSTKIIVQNVESKPGKRSAPAPFTTSTLQQTASNVLGLSVKRTMILAQKLYESGHITYMRTDSYTLSETATKAIRRLIEQEHGKEYLGPKRSHKSSKGAQEAHEAIRPTNISKPSAGSDKSQQGLYRLIRNRTLASQMSPAKITNTKVELKSDHQETLTAKGMKIEFPGFLKVMRSSAFNENILPNMGQGDEVQLIEAQAQEQSQKPPARFSEATLVKELEKLGIGRPSTYAPTISTVQTRGYVDKKDIKGQPVEYTLLSVKPNQPVVQSKVEDFFGSEKSRLAPTDKGLLVNKFLTKHFDEIVDYDFTANIEKEFDQVATGEIKWQEMIDEFYKPFQKHLDKVDREVKKSDTGSVIELGKHPESGEPIVARFARFGPVFQMGSTEDEEKPKFAPLPKGKSINDVTLDDALRMLQLPRKVGKTDEGEDIEASIGRYGPYIRVGKKFVSIEEEQVFDIDAKQAITLIKEDKKQKKKTEIKKFDDGNITVKTGRFGPYVTNGKVNAKIPKKYDPEKLTYEQAQELINKKTEKK